MYLDYFGLTQRPFSISPDPSFLFPSIGHQEALAHLQYTLSNHGGLVALTGEVGMGKTMLCRAFINGLDEKAECAYIFNPQLSASELLQNLCQELLIPCPKSNSIQELTQALFSGLMDKYIKGIRVLCIIDEAQSMPLVLLEQIRLITNLETNHQKLLTLILVGQPELAKALMQPSMRQLNQRINARYHLNALNNQEVFAYIEHRMSHCGCTENPFNSSALKEIATKSRGIPRLINSLADRALLGAYAQNSKKVNRTMVQKAAEEIGGYESYKKDKPWLYPAFISAFCVLLVLAAAFMLTKQSNNTAFELEVASPELESQPENSAELKLAQAYQLNAQNCEQIKQTNWQCLALNWPLDELQRLKRPVMIETTEGWQAMGLETKGDFLGNALILWQPPANYEGLIRPNEQAQVVQWVRNKLKLNMLDWVTIAPTNTKNKKRPAEDFYDPILAKAVGDFQNEMGIVSDKIIGPQTLLYLQEKSD